MYYVFEMEFGRSRQKYAIVAKDFSDAVARAVALSENSGAWFTADDLVSMQRGQRIDGVEVRSD